MKTHLIAAGVVWLLWNCAGYAEMVFTPLPVGFSVNAVSADGRVAIGYNRLKQSAQRWQSDGTNVFYGPQVTLSDLSDSGSISVGSAPVEVPSGSGGTYMIARAAFWRDAAVSPIVISNSLRDDSAWLVSADGQVIAGAYDRRGAFWDAPAEQGTFLAAREAQAFPRGISANGSVIVGGAMRGLAPYSFRWTRETGIVDIGELSTAEAVSGDGRVVFGSAQDGEYRWTESTGMILLNGLPDRAQFLGANLDGTVALRANGIWTASGGFLSLGTLIGSWGLSLDQWSELSFVDMNLDASLFAGTGIDPEGQFRSFIISGAPIPEASALTGSMCLLLLGAAGLRVLRHRCLPRAL